MWWFFINPRGENQGNEEISQLGEFKPRTKSTQTISLVDHYYDADGNRRVKGNGNLKASQAYPLGLLALWYGVVWCDVVCLVCM